MPYGIMGMQRLCEEAPEWKKIRRTYLCRKKESTAQSVPSNADFIKGQCGAVGPDTVVKMPPNQHTGWRHHTSDLVQL